MDLTELIELDPERVDGVGAPANGLPFLMLKSLDDEYSEFVKSKYNAKQLRQLKAKGETFPGTTSYPIADAEDLSNAIHAVGRGKVAGHDKIRAYIIRRAKEMGKESEFPDNWGSDGSLTKADEYGKKPKDDEGDSHEDEKIKGKDTSGDGSGDGTGTHNDEVEKAEPATDKAVDAAIDKLKAAVADLVEAQKKDVAYASKADADSDGTGDDKPELSDEEQKSNEERVQHAEKSGKRISSASESKIRAAMQALEDLLDSGDAADKGKDIQKMTADELTALVDQKVEKALDEADKARRESEVAKAKAEKKVAKKAARNAKKKGKAAKGTKEEGAEGATDVSKSETKSIADELGESISKTVAEAVAKAVAPLEAKVRDFESLPGKNIPSNEAVAILRGQETSSPQAQIIKSLQDELAKAQASGDRVRAAQISTDLSKARLTQVFANASVR